MKHKVRIFLIVCAAAALLLLSSCELWWAVFGDPLAGTWVVTAQTVDGNPVPIGTGPSQVSVTMVIKDDNTLTTTGTAMGTPFAGTGTWARTDSTCTLSFTNNVSGQTQYGTISGSLSSDNKTFTGSGTAVMGSSTQIVNSLVMQKQ